MTPATTYVRETIELVKQIETRFLELGARLWKIREARLWEGVYESYEDFLFDTKISPGNASKLVKVYQTFVIEHSIPQEKLAGTGYSNLYTAIPLIEKGGVQKAITAAQTLSRSEIIDELKEKKYGVHEHEVGDERFGVCKICGKMVRVDA